MPAPGLALSFDVTARSIISVRLGPLDDLQHASDYDGDDKECEEEHEHDSRLSPTWLWALGPAVGAGIGFIREFPVAFLTFFRRHCFYALLTSARNLISSNSLTIHNVHPSMGCVQRPRP